MRDCRLPNKCIVKFFTQIDFINYFKIIFYILIIENILPRYILAEWKHCTYLIKGAAINEKINIYNVGILYTLLKNKHLPLKVDTPSASVATLPW